MGLNCESRGRRPRPSSERRRREITLCLYPTMSTQILHDAKPTIALRLSDNLQLCNPMRLFGDDLVMRKGAGESSRRVFSGGSCLDL